MWRTIEYLSGTIICKSESREVARKAMAQAFSRGFFLCYLDYKPMCRCLSCGKLLSGRYVSCWACMKVADKDSGRMALALEETSHE